MKIIAGLALCLIIIIVAVKLISTADSSPESTAPRYTWAAFSSFWNRHAVEEVKLKDAQKVAGGYLVNYGNGVQINISEKNRIITAACANFYGKNNDAGGMTFMKIRDKMINLGTFRWPYENVLEVRSLFANIGKYDINYSYRASHFSLVYANSSGWTLCLRFVSAPTIE